MIKDLSQSTEPCVTCSATVCIIGAGTAGIFLAQRLRHVGIGVVILEAGDGLSRKPEDAKQRCVQHGIRYRGADQGRSFGLGGTSVLWGGQMIPLMPSDMDARPAVGIEPWPISYADVAAYLPTVKQALGLVAGAPLEEQAVISKYFLRLSQLDADFQLRLSEWLPFKARNFAKAYAKFLRADAGLEVWICLLYTSPSPRD